MQRLPPAERGIRRLLLAVSLSASALSARVASAVECADDPHLSACFDVNPLWLPAGRASFLSMPDTRVVQPGELGLGSAAELLHQPVVLRAPSPDRDGRSIQVVQSALDVSYFLSLGLLRNLELSMLASLRVRQSGAGVGGIDSQSAPPLSHNAVRDPRVGVAYSFDHAISVHGLGLRLAVDATLPLGDRAPFANERSFVVMPNATLGFQHRWLLLSAELGVRLRQSVDFGGVTLGNQGFVALGMAAFVIPRWLSLSAEIFGLPSLSDSRSRAESSHVTRAHLFPAEWLAGAHSAFGTQSPWTLSVAAGSGLPFSSETRQSSSGSETNYFTGVTTPDFRALAVVRFAPVEIP